LRKFLQQKSLLQPWCQPTTACSELHKPVQLFKFSGET
jgi:hypothetical protein